MVEQAHEKHIGSEARKECRDLWRQVYARVMGKSFDMEGATKLANNAVERYINTFYKQENKQDPVETGAFI